MGAGPANSFSSSYFKDSRALKAQKRDRQPDPGAEKGNQRFRICGAAPSTETERKGQQGRPGDTVLYPEAPTQPFRAT